MIITLTVAIMMLMSSIAIVMGVFVITRMTRWHPLVDICGVVLNHRRTGDDHHFVRMVAVVAMPVVVALMVVHIDHPVMAVAVATHRNLHSYRGVDLNMFAAAQHSNSGQQRNK